MSTLYYVNSIYSKMSLMTVVGLYAIHDEEWERIKDVLLDKILVLRSYPIPLQDWRIWASLR